MMLEKEFVRLWLPITCFTIHSTDRQKCSIFNHILWLCAKIRGKWEETPWNREQWDVKMSLDLDTGAASLLLPLLLRTMKIKTFGAMVVEKPHFWLTIYQILIVLQFPHICKHTRKQMYCVRVGIPIYQFPSPTLAWEGAVSPILNCMGVYSIFPITKYKRGWSETWCLKVKAHICHVCHYYSDYTFMVPALEKMSFLHNIFGRKCAWS